MSLTSTEIVRFRLINQQLINTTFKTGKEMVSWFGAVQGQEYAQTKWSLGLRLPHLKDADIEKELTEGKILRTHLLRPTWHFVSPDDIRWLLLLSAPRVNAINSFMYRKLELDNSIFKRSNDIIIKALQGNKQLTRTELNSELKKNRITAEGHRLSYIMMRSELDGIICSGVIRGKQFTYALIDERVPPSKIKNKEEALAELTKRYFTSRGPATVKDFATWSGLTLTDCKKGIGLIKDYLTYEKPGDEYFFIPENVRSGKKRFRGFYLLPVYDELIMGYKDRSAFLQLRNSIKSKPEFKFDNTIFSDGQIAGTWKRTFKKSIELEYNFFKKPDEKQLRLLRKSIKRLKEFTGLEVNYS